VLLTQDEREILARQIADRVKLTYWAAAGAQQTVELLKRGQQNMQQTIEYHEIQLKEGAIAEGDVIRVRLEGDRTNVALENAERDAMNTKLALQREMGREAFVEIRLVDNVNDQPAPPPVDIGHALEARADLHQVRQAVEQARANVRLQQANAKPDVEVLGGYKRTVGFNTFMWGAQVPLPFFNKNQGNIATAESDVSAAEARVRAIETQIRAEIEAAQRDVEARRQRLASLVTGTLARADESVAIARAAYREGGTDLLRLLDAERIYIELEVMNARMHMEYRQSLVTLETALGVSR
jgi:outer membrane protein TolC